MACVAEVSVVISTYQLLELPRQVVQVMLNVECDVCLLCCGDYLGNGVLRCSGVSTWHLMVSILGVGREELLVTRMENV